MKLPASDSTCDTGETAGVTKAFKIFIGAKYREEHMKKEIKVKSNSHSYIEKILNRWKEWLIMYSSIISSAAISSASSFTSATIAANMAARNFVTSTDNSIYSFLTMNMKIIHILLFVLICIAFCVTFYITYKTFKNN